MQFEKLMQQQYQMWGIKKGNMIAFESKVYLKFVIYLKCHSQLSKDTF